MVDLSQRGGLAQRRPVGSNRGEWQWGGVLCAPLCPPSTTNLSSLSSSSHPDPLRQPIYSASNTTIHWICNCTVSALDLCGTRSKSRSLQMGEFRAAWLAGALFELVQLELCKLSWAGNMEAIFSWIGSASSGRHWTDLKRPWQVNQVRMVNQQEVYVQGCFRNSNQIKDNIFTQRKRPKRVSCKSTDIEFWHWMPYCPMDRPSWHRPFIRLTECSMGQCHTQTQTTQITCFLSKNFPQLEF